MCVRLSRLRGLVLLIRVVVRRGLRMAFLLVTCRSLVLRVRIL